MDADEQIEVTQDETRRGAEDAASKNTQTGG